MVLDRQGKHDALVITMKRKKRKNDDEKGRALRRILLVHSRDRENKREYDLENEGS